MKVVINITKHYKSYFLKLIGDALPGFEREKSAVKNFSIF
ncbi:hypothetical protein HMPREF9996_00026 [Aggregatibacter actinomycetemcomitans Y4]|nr:hypothetical protein CF65_02041 [Aggregatibacter actinomycetemcomitans HK1651]EKX99472.1 hypothetical protein HMPREF9996_00026 [Aggregatibacter actinomycetemcomitans Y4]